MSDRQFRFHVQARPLTATVTAQYFAVHHERENFVVTLFSL